MNEDELIASILQPPRNMVVGIGDDAAVYRPRAGEDLLLTTDYFIDGVHFKRDKREPEEIGRDALARSLSDIAAMGGTPRCSLLALIVPSWVDDDWLARLYTGYLVLSQQTETELAGGDIARSETLVCNVTVIGTVPKGKALRRDGARAGDLVYVSGPLGGWRKRRRIEPRLDIGMQLLGKANSAIDITDGLALDLHRVCKASRVSAALDDVPLLEGASLKQALHDGEDYELLYTVPPHLNVPGICIGRIEDGEPGTVTLNGKRVPAKGYDHLQHRS